VLVAGDVCVGVVGCCVVWVLASLVIFLCCLSSVVMGLGCYRCGVACLSRWVGGRASVGVCRVSLRDIPPP